VAERPGAGGDSLLLLSHLDVAPPGDPGEWQNPPFCGALIDGEVWGRGAVDIKGLAAAHFSVLLALRDLNLKRRVIMAAVAEEESAGLHGTAWLLHHCSAVRSCRWALSEGGGWILACGPRRFVTVQTGEKGVIRARARRRTSSPERELSLPACLTPSATRLVSRMTGLPEIVVASMPAGVALVLADAAQRRAPYRVDLRQMLYHTCSVRDLHDGTAEILCRVVPGGSLHDVLTRAAGALGLELVGGIEAGIDPAESDPRSDLIEALEKVSDHPVAPVFTPGPSDNHWLREAGMRVYGFFPGPSPAEVLRIHRANERLSVEAFRTAVAGLVRLVTRFSMC
jgi:acetylornithine deacetylase/succinyl-diaminopimelate desuccinylase-like protein